MTGIIALRRLLRGAVIDARVVDSLRLLLLRVVERIVRLRVRRDLSLRMLGILGRILRLRRLGILRRRRSVRLRGFFFI